MAFDCFIVNFNNKESDKNLSLLLEKFPYARVVPFISGYHDIIKSLIGESRTTHTWMLTTKVDYTNFDFDFIPEQHQSTQLHVWNNPGQKEGDTFLLPKDFKQQEIRFLRDYQDVNYHKYDVAYDFDFFDLQYNLSLIHI